MDFSGETFPPLEGDLKGVAASPPLNDGVIISPEGKEAFNQKQFDEDKQYLRLQSILRKTLLHIQDHKKLPDVCDWDIVCFLQDDGFIEMELDDKDVATGKAKLVGRADATLEREDRMDRYIKLGKL